MPCVPATASSWCFAGLRVPTDRRATGRRALRWCDEAGEWVRPLVLPQDWREPWDDGPPARRWVVDFPPGADAHAITAAGTAGQAFQRSGGRIVRRGRGAELRIALAKCDRYLAAPAGAGPARWRWMPAEVLPGGDLVVVARDDEFLAGVLASWWLAVWQRGRRRRLEVATVRTLPLPWSPEMLRGALTRDQEERREAVVRAWRALGGGVVDAASEGDAAEELAAAVAAAYGWPAGIGPADGFARLEAMAPAAG